LPMVWLTADCVLCSRNAAREKLRSWATATNASSWYKSMISDTLPRDQDFLLKHKFLSMLQEK
jgi:hypothetical protein